MMADEGIEWHRRIDTGRGLTPEQLAAVVEAIGARVSRYPDDDYVGGLSGGAENALETIAGVVGMV